MAQVELEHAIGYSSHIPQSVLQHPRSKSSYVFISGCVCVLNDSSDPHAQQFLRGHDDSLSCLAISNNGNCVATGQKGANADVCLWDFKSHQLVHRLGEHENGVSSINFSHDDVSLKHIDQANLPSRNYWPPSETL